MTARGTRKSELRPNAAGLFLDQYFPFHYEVGFTVERHMRDPRLTQHQGVILWIIHATGEQGVCLSRKAIEQRLQTWFEVTSSAISKAIRSLAKPPLGLITIEEHPRSGREKLIHLTPDGERAVLGMVERGQQIIQRIVDQMNDREISQGLHFLRSVSAIVNAFEPTANPSRETR